MSRSRPYQHLGGPELVRKLFDAALSSEAKVFEDLLYEVEGGDDHWNGRKMSNLRSVIVECANRVFEASIEI